MADRPCQTCWRGVGGLLGQQPYHASKLGGWPNLHHTNSERRSKWVHRRYVAHLKCLSVYRRCAGEPKGEEVTRFLMNMNLDYFPQA